MSFFVHIIESPSSVDLLDGRTEACATLQEKVNAEKAFRNLESEWNRLRRDLYEEQDKIDQRRGTLIEGIEKQRGTQSGTAEIFVVQWEI